MLTARFALEVISTIANRRVMEILELPEGEREQRYQRDWKACYEASLTATGREALAREQADRMVRWMRRRVDSIECR